MRERSFDSGFVEAEEWLNEHRRTQPVGGAKRLRCAWHTAEQKSKNKLEVSSKWS